MRDEMGVDAKLLCVPSSDRRWDHVQDLNDLPDHQLTEISHFFEIYKDLEPGKMTEPAGWSNRESAEEEVRKGRERAGRPGEG
jgi:inorganic pyrophosphatase